MKRTIQSNKIWTCCWCDRMFETRTGADTHTWKVHKQEILKAMKKSDYQDMLEAQYPKIPRFTIQLIVHYVYDHTPGGDFLNAVVSNDLMRAVRRADLENQRALPDICSLLATHAPDVCYGSPEAFRDWTRRPVERRAEKIKEFCEALNAGSHEPGEMTE